MTSWLTTQGRKRESLRVQVLTEQQSGALAYNTARFRAADAESLVQVHVTIEREAKR